MRLFSILVFVAACACGETQPDSQALEPGLYAVIRTSMGSITAKLFEKEAPSTVNSFVALASGGMSWRDPESSEMVSRPLYRNLSFDRVLPNSVIQTGDPTGTGRYDCGLRLKDEFVDDLKFDRPGRLGIMNFGQPDTGGCQFFITNDAYPGLDPYPGNHGYTVFGQVISGQEIVNRISNLPRDAKDRPRVPVKLLSVTIQRVGPGQAPPKRRGDSPARKILIPN